MTVRRLFHARFLTAVVCAVAGALGALAWLQMRWIGEAARIEESRRRAAVQRSATGFAIEFNGELGRLFAFLAPPGPPPTRPGSAGLQAELERWQRGTSHGAMVKGLYLASTDGDLPPRLSAFEQRIRRRGREGPPFQFEIDSEIPVLAVRRNPPFERAEMPWIVVEMDGDYLRAVMLPQLAAKYFGADFAVSIVDRASGRLIFGTDRNRSADATAGLLEMRMGPPGRPRPAFAPDNQPRWELRARYLLESRAERNRMWNIAISVFALVTLAASLAFLAIAARRAQLLARQQMDFVSGVSHELRTPLAVISSAGDNLASGVAKSPEQVSRYGAMVANEARRLNRIVEQILGFANIEAGRAGMDLKPLPVKDVLELSIAASGVRCPIHQASPDDLPPMLADQTALSQSIANLLANAEKHGDGADVRIAAAHRNGFVDIEVSDRGHGIPSEELARIFDPFYRGERARKDQMRGLGLGLNLVKRLIEAQGGRISAASDRERGTRFTISMPASRQGER